MTGVFLAVALLEAPVPVSGQQTAAKLPVKLRVLLPQADATLVIEGAETQQTGESRVFVSPPLEPGQSYTYTVAATWEPNNYTKITRTRKVSVKAGQELEVDLRKIDDSSPDKIVVRYVPTPDEVVNAMCKLGEVAKGDIVYDLGCGDGRIVITAVKDYGAKRGVGVDIDPERIADSQANAKKASVEDRVEFRKQDVLQLKDIGDANVVMLYMGDDLNLAIRPILQKSLKPGSRVVSHRFLMGDWKPDKTIQVKDSDGIEYDLHLWRIGPGSERKD
jgi:uncharacterized protein (TIGR03000 family)